MDPVVSLQHKDVVEQESDIDCLVDQKIVPGRRLIGTDPEHRQGQKALGSNDRGRGADGDPGKDRDHAANI